MPEFATKQDIIFIREDMKAHNDSDEAFQERIFKYLQIEFFNLNAKINTLWDEKNKRDGAEGSDEKNKQSSVNLRDRIAVVGGWSLNACIAAITAYATIRGIKP